MSETPFKINFSKSDIESEPTSFEPVPNGEYICNVTKVELLKVKSGDNKGKHQMNVELTVDVDNGDYVKRKFWTNIMLFELEYRDGTKGNFMLAQFLKATGFPEALKTGNVPAAPAYMGKKVMAVVTKKKQSEEYGGGYRNVVAGFRALDGANDSRDSNSNLPR